MTAKELDEKSTQAAREKFRKAEQGEISGAEEFGRLGTADNNSAVSVE